MFDKNCKKCNFVQNIKINNRKVKIMQLEAEREMFELAAEAIKHYEETFMFSKISTRRIGTGCQKTT